MVISFNTGKVETTGGSGTGLLQQKKVTITENGLDVVVPDAGYDGLSTVYVKTYVSEPSGMKDFSVLGYDEELNISLNEGIDADIAYSKELYDAWNPDNTSAKSLYYQDKQLVYAPAIDVELVTDNSSMFGYCKSLEVVPKYNFTSLKIAVDTFRECNLLTSLDLSGWDISAIERIQAILYYCNRLNDVDVSGWDLSNVSSIESLFSYCYVLSNIKGIENWYAPNLKNIYYLFKSCEKVVSLDLSQWGCKIITNISNAFDGCTGLTSLDLSGWDLSNVTGTSSTFYYCKSLTNLKFGNNIKKNFELKHSTNLTVDSLMSIIEGLYDFTSNGETPNSSSQGKIGFGTTNLAKLSDEQKAIATAKGWTLS